MAVHTRAESLFHILREGIRGHRDDGKPRGIGTPLYPAYSLRRLIAVHHRHLYIHTVQLDKTVRSIRGDNDEQYNRDE